MTIITDEEVAAIPATDDRQEIKIEGIKGLILIIQPTGLKTWAWRGRINGKVVKRTLGRFTDHSVAAALEWATLLNVTEKRDTVRAAATITCDQAFALYMKAEGDSRKSGKEKWRVWKKEFQPQIGHLLFASIESSAFMGIILAKAGSPIAANRMASMISRWLKWSETHGRDEIGPLLVSANHIGVPFPESTRERTLSRCELSLFVRALDRLNGAFASAFRIMLYTGCHRSEVLEARWSEINISTREWLIPASRSHSERPHLVYLSDSVCDALRALPRNTDLIFPSRDKASVPISGVSRATERLREMISEIAEHEEAEHETWQFHDVRRTIASHLSENGISRNAVDLMLDLEPVANPSSPLGVYNHYARFAEKKTGWDAWANHLDQMRIASAQTPVPEKTDPVIRPDFRKPELRSLFIERLKKTA